LQNQPSITALPDGTFVAVWTDGSGIDSSGTGDDVSGSSVRGQIFNSDGTKSGAEFLVNTATDFAQWQPSITTLADGRFAVAWQD